MQALLKIVANLGLKLLTETVISKLVIYALEAAAKKSTNKLDDSIVETVKKAWL